MGTALVLDVATGYTCKKEFLFEICLCVNLFFFECGFKNVVFFFKKTKTKKHQCKQPLNAALNRFYSMSVSTGSALQVSHFVKARQGNFKDLLSYCDVDDSQM